MNSASVGLERVESEWELWDRLRKEFHELPIIGCIGNQDCWGWNQKLSRCTGAEPLFGKAMALARIPLAQPFYAVTVGGWRLIVLDSVQRGGRHGFVPEIDEVQRAWLGAELEADRETPTVIVSHVPLIPGPAEFAGAEISEPSKTGDWVLGGSTVHADGPSLVSLLRNFPSVKLCLSGHTHIPQRIEFGGITFAVIPPLSGAWWRGPFQGFEGGFAFLDLLDNGEFLLSEGQVSSFLGK